MAVYALRKQRLGPMMSDDWRGTGVMERAEGRRRYLTATSEWWRHGWAHTKHLSDYKLGNCTQVKIKSVKLPKSLLAKPSGSRACASSPGTHTQFPRVLCLGGAETDWAQLLTRLLLSPFRLSNPLLLSWTWHIGPYPSSACFPLKVGPSSPHPFQCFTNKCVTLG